MALQAACAGQGVVLATTALAIDDLDAGRLVEPFDLRIPTPFAYYAVTTQSTARAETVRCFVKWLLEEAGHSRRR